MLDLRWARQLEEQVGGGSEGETTDRSAATVESFPEECRAKQPFEAEDKNKRQQIACLAHTMAENALEDETKLKTFLRAEKVRWYVCNVDVIQKLVVVCNGITKALEERVVEHYNNNNNNNTSDSTDGNTGVEPVEDVTVDFWSTGRRACTPYSSAAL